MKARMVTSALLVSFILGTGSALAGNSDLVLPRDPPIIIPSPPWPGDPGFELPIPPDWPGDPDFELPPNWPGDPGFPLPRPESPVESFLGYLLKFLRILFG